MSKKRDLAYEKYQKNPEFSESPRNIKQHILSLGSSFASVEAYKAARTNLLFTRRGESCQKIVFTSAYPNEGKSTNCINTAITLAQNGQKVLIIDADLRKPILHYVFDLPPDVGLSNILVNIPNSNSVFPPETFIHKTQYNNLFVLPAGLIPPNPAELLSSPQMHRLLKALEEDFDYILIDSPPFLVVTDAAVLIPEVSGHVLVVKAGVTQMEALKATVMRLEQLNATLLGFILNGVEAKKGSYNYSGYSRYGKKYGNYRNYSRSKLYGSNDQEQVNNNLPQNDEENVEVARLANLAVTQMFFNKENKNESPSD